MFGMARRQRRSNGEAAVLAAAAVLPWWACLALAAVSYFGLHAVSTRPVPPVDPRQPTALLQSAAVQALFTVGQYVLPIGLLAAGAVSFARRRRRENLLQNATASDATQSIGRMSWQDFEALIGEGFRRKGYEVRERTKGGADGGVDLVLRKAGETFFVQAKHWKAFRVGVDVVRGFYGVMAAEGAAGGFVVTSGRFTDEAMALANGRNVTLIDGPALEQLLAEGKGGSAPMGAATGASREAAPDDAEPSCPRCARRMVLRAARRGASAGQAFWGCSAYSEGCRGTRPA